MTPATAPLLSAAEAQTLYPSGSHKGNG